VVITIDGPTASGKSTVGRMLAKELGYYYVYSGLLYRALAYLLIQNRNYTEQNLHAPTHTDLATYFDVNRFVYKYDDQFKERVFFDGQDITPHLKMSIIDRSASILSLNQKVREAVTLFQQKVAQRFDVVVDGRDAGTIVFPDADYKFFLTASLSVRAERWSAQQAQMGNDFSLSDAIAGIAERDMRDEQRDIAPLHVADGAIVIDNSDLTINQTLETMLQYIQK
jgi:cytidylate kinase